MLPSKPSMTFAPGTYRLHLDATSTPTGDRVVTTAHMTDEAGNRTVLTALDLDYLARTMTITES